MIRNKGKESSGEDKCSNLLLCPVIFAFPFSEDSFLLPPLLRLPLHCHHLPHPPHLPPLLHPPPPPPLPDPGLEFR